MSLEPGIGQREIVGRKVAFADAEIDTKYTLPFVDRTWHVPFVVFDVLGGPPQLLVAKVQSSGGMLRTPASIDSLRAIESIPMADFASLVHFDPWWAFRGVSGVERDWITAIFLTNIAGTFNYVDRRCKIHDLRFSDGMDRLEAVVAKDESFHRRAFLRGDLDLLELRARPKDRRLPQELTRSAKAL